MIVAAIVYVAIGALAAWWARARPGDALALALLWPIYGPVVLERGPRSGREAGALDAAVTRVGRAPVDWLVRVDDARAALRALDRVLARHAGAVSDPLDDARADRARRRAALDRIDGLIAAIATQLELAPLVAGADAALVELLDALADEVDRLGNKPLASGVL